jgi:hypothetical protein
LTDAKTPNQVLYAEIALWLWTVYTCLNGIYETWRQIPTIEEAINTQLQGMIAIDPNNMLIMAIVGYGLLAIVSCWFIVKIGQGRPWARNSLLWGVLLQIVIIAVPPYHDAPLDYLNDIPDLGLQICALNLLYGAAARPWFEPLQRVGCRAGQTPGHA